MAQKPKRREPSPANVLMKEILRKDPYEAHADEVIATLERITHIKATQRETRSQVLRRRPGRSARGPAHRSHDTGAARSLQRLRDQIEEWIDASIEHTCRGGIR